MYEPLVSIIIPVYNGSDYLRESIESALAQSYKNIEILVINDGSSDNEASENIALSYGNRIRYYYKQNGGVSSALNFGIQKMRGEWFSWLSHDDLYLPDKIDSAIRLINENNFDHNKTIISCRSGLINSKGENIYKHQNSLLGFYSGKEMYKYLCKGKGLSGCNLLIPKSALQSVNGFALEYRFIQDWVCWINLALKGYNFYLYNDELVKTRVHGMQNTIKLADIRPKEISSFLNRLLIELSSTSSDSHYYLKVILYNYCTINSGKKIRLKYIDQLKEHNTFGPVEHLKYNAFLLKGKLVLVLKKIYRLFVNLKYRSNTN